ncbi:MAG: PmoA family protein [Planctomycetes bacterium]|nr:PmoA family protein [Planctomycetota bacterium]
MLAPKPLVLVVLLACHSVATQDGTIRIAADGDVVRVLDGERPLLAYRASGHAWKAFAERLCTPAGTDVLQVAPADHVHHRGLIFALGADDHDYWGEHYVEAPGRQRGGPLEHLEARADSGRRTASFAHAIEWLAGEPERVHLRERRQIAVTPASDATLVTWRTALTVPDDHEPVRLWGRPYFGLGLRFAAEMDGEGRFFCASGDAGQIVRGDERLRRATWCAYTAGTRAGAVTVAMFDHPDNPRHPASWFTMARPFAFMTATLALAAEPLELPPGPPLELCYGIALFDGVVGPERIEEHYRAWLADDPTSDDRR